MIWLKHELKDNFEKKWIRIKEMNFWTGLMIVTDFVTDVTAAHTLMNQWTENDNQGSIDRFSYDFYCYYLLLSLFLFVWIGMLWISEATGELKVVIAS